VNFEKLKKNPGSIERVVYEILHKGGYQIWVESFMTNLLDDPNINAVVINYSDITDRIKTEKELRESEERFRTLADNIPNLAWMAHADGEFFWFNKRWYEYTKATPQHMEKNGWQSIPDPKELPNILERWHKSLMSGESFEMIFPLKGTDGLFRPFLTRIIPVKDTARKIISWFGTSTDITKIKELENQKEEFMSIVSHELKTPVTSLKSFVQVLELRFKKEGNENASMLLLKMDAQINRLNILITDLLDINKIEGGKLQFNNDFFLFDELVSEVVEDVQRTSEKHTIVIKGGTKKTIYADKDRIGQVITNILTNAIKYSPHTKKIILETITDRKTITLCIQDFGIGIQQKKLPHIFERFYRETGQIESTYPGLGLGLYISNEIIRRGGGTMTAESTKGKGSTFCFTIPIKDKEKDSKKII
jgi:PAS domain S-box-containing protein